MSERGQPLPVRLDGLSRRYQHRVKGEVWAARDVTLSIAPGEFLTLLGPSGCGKTTTLRMEAGFEPPDAGRLWIGEREMGGTPAHERNMGFVFQNYALFPHLTIAENVAYGLRVRGRPDAEVRTAVTEVLALVGLAGYEQQLSSQLSGGEQQRVALARAIVIRPGVLLFDEPLSNLDARLRVAMRDEIRALQQRLGITTIYVTHDQEEAMAVSDRIVVMNRGRVVQQGTAEDLYHRPASGFVARFIGRINALPAKVVAKAGEGVEVEALGRRFAVASAPPTLAVGQHADLLVRPEALRLVAADDPQARLVGTLERVTFLGEKTELALRCGGEPLLVLQPSAVASTRPAVGAAVGVAFDPDALLVLPREEAA